MSERVERLAAVLAETYTKETGKKVKWPHLAPCDRSLWRQIARQALAEMNQQPSNSSPDINAMTAPRHGWRGVGN